MEGRCKIPKIQVDTWLDVIPWCSFAVSLHLWPKADENLAVVPAYHQCYSAWALINPPSRTSVCTEANRESMEMSTEVRGNTSTLRRLNCRQTLMLVLPLAIAGSVFYLFFFGLNLARTVSWDWNRIFLVRALEIPGQNGKLTPTKRRVCSVNSSQTLLCCRERHIRYQNMTYIDPTSSLLLVFTWHWELIGPQGFLSLYAKFQASLIIIKNYILKISFLLKLWF